MDLAAGGENRAAQDIILNSFMIREFLLYHAFSNWNKNHQTWKLFWLFRRLLDIMLNTCALSLHCYHGDREASAFINRHEQRQMIFVPQQHHNKNETSTAVFLISHRVGIFDHSVKPISLFYSEWQRGSFCWRNGLYSSTRNQKSWRRKLNL